MADAKRAASTPMPTPRDGSSSTDPVQTEIRKIEVPTYYAASVQIFLAVNDASLMFTRPTPGTLPNGALSTIAMIEPVALIQMSIETLKDLAVLIGDQIEQIEVSRGSKIETDYPRRRDEQRKAQPQH
jgi:hypothetical protein